MEGHCGVKVSLWWTSSSKLWRNNTWTYLLTYLWGHVDIFGCLWDFCIHPSGTEVNEIFFRVLTALKKYVWWWTEALFLSLKAEASILAHTKNLLCGGKNVSPWLFPSVVVQLEMITIISRLKMMMMICNLGFHFEVTLTMWAYFTLTCLCCRCEHVTALNCNVISLFLLLAYVLAIRKSLWVHNNINNGVVPL